MSGKVLDDYPREAEKIATNIAFRGGDRQFMVLRTESGMKEHVYGRGWISFHQSESEANDAADHAKEREQGAIVVDLEGMYTMPSGMLTVLRDVDDE